MSDTVGSILGVNIAGLTLNAAADANITETGGKFENDGIPTSGGNIRKMTKRVDVKEGVTLITNADEFETLKLLAEGTVDFPMSYTQANGDTYRTGLGWIELENRETEEGKTTIKMFPRKQFDLFNG